MSTLLVPKWHVRPDSGQEIVDRARILLVRADSLGVLPTPIHRLYDFAKVGEIELNREEASSFLSKFTQRAKDAILGIINQVRGAADLKKRVVFVPQGDTKPRILFARAHELGHQVLPWHNLNEDYLDSQQTLSPSIKNRFEIEANLFAAEVIFQGARFQQMARQYRPDFVSVMDLARRHGASKQATFWHFVEVHDEAVAGMTFYPIDKESGPQGLQTGLVMYKFVRSAAFARRYGSITFDARLGIQHEWAQACFAARQSISGEMFLPVDGRDEAFLWEAFWNRHALMVMVRRRPILHSISHIFGGSTAS